MQDKSGNPAFKSSVLDKLGSLEGAQSATIGGTTAKIFVLLMLTLLGGFLGWGAMAGASSSTMILIIGASIVAFVLALVTIFKPLVASFTGPLYALAQGYVLGAISQVYNASFDGIVVQAISLTGVIFFVSLWAFSAGLIRVTEKFRTGVLIATIGIGLYYLVAFVMGLFGASMPLIYDTGAFGIIFSLVVIFIATLNLILDFDQIQRMVNSGASKRFEWYGAFALMVTLIWLYIEVLRLLGKTRQ